MTLSKNEAKAKIQDLVNKFKEHIQEYKKASYNEASLRIDFLNKFFKYLDWDVENKQSLPPSFREVITEDNVQIEGRSKSPDYSFREKNGKRMFFVEAKKPFVNISKHEESAFQLRRYGWSADLSVSLLTSFEYFAVYDCTIRPKDSDKSSFGRLKLIHFEEYLNEFDYIWDNFSKSSVMGGSLNQFMKEKKGKRGTASVDKDFLDSLDIWRIALAKDIIYLNNSLDEYQINEAVQQIIDRIIFLRIAEDRKVENDRMVFKTIASDDCYKSLLILFKTSDNKYNSGLFKKSVSDKIKVSDSVLRKIIKGLYYPDSPYEFSVMPIEILGKAYEQFLGKRIDLTPGGNIKIESKPEVRKAGGVYYTPRFIVEYIVKNTVGKLCEGKTPEEVAKLTIVDPACGSGSFLVYAYEYLLNWHRDYFVKNKPSKKSRNEILTPDEGELTTKFKGQILLNNIFGVDIDSSAVEVTKLSLLLKCMEGETKDSVFAQMELFQERLLPTLDDNIKCGNSLIDFDIYSLFPDLGDDIKLKRRINAFNWKNGFKEVFQNSGFDAVIGNPPYGYMISEYQQKYFEITYKYQDYQKDYYLLFLERYAHFLKDKGILGVIVSNTWLQAVNLRKIRSYLLTNYSWKKILLLPERVFDAVVDTHILIFRKDKPKGSDTVLIESLNNGRVLDLHIINQLEIKTEGEVINVSANPEIKKIQNKINLNSVKLSDFCSVFNGVKPFEKGKGNPPQTQQIMDEKPYVKEGMKPKGKNWLPLLRGSLINKYAIFWDNNYWIKYGEWLAAPRDKKIFDNSEMLFVRQTGDSLIAAYSKRKFIARDNLHIIVSNKINIKYLLGLLNSTLMNFVYSFINPEKGKALAQIKKHHLEILPVKPIDFNKKSQLLIYNEIVAAVNLILKLKEQVRGEKDPDTRHLKKEISFLEDKINNLVYQLYGLSKEEIRIIETEEEKNEK